MKKTMFLLNVLTLLTFVVANCGDNTMVEGKNNDNGSLKLDPAIETQIKQNWLEQFGSPLSTVNYYGTHNGYVAFFLPGANTVVTVVEIAGTIFQYGSDWTIYLWKDGIFYDMIDAYEQGLVNSENISKIGDFHRKFIGAKSQEIDYAIVFENMSTGLAQNRESLVSTFAEWKIIRDANDVFVELDAKINERFFAANSLVVYAFTRNWIGLEAKVTEVSRMGNELVINVTHIDGDMAILTHGIVIIEIAKEDITNVSSLRIVSD